MNTKTIRHRLLATTAFAITIATSAMAEDDHQTKEAWRLFIADHTLPVVRAIDFETGKGIGSL